MAGTVFVIDELEAQNDAFPYLVDGKRVRNLWIRAVNSTGSTINGHKVVTLDSSNTLVLATNATSAHATQILGLTLGSITNGSTGMAQTTGQVTEGSWSWTPGDELFLDTGGDLKTYGSLSGGRLFDRMVAVAVSSTIIQLTGGIALIK